METKTIFSLMGGTIRYLDQDFENGDLGRVKQGANSLKVLADELLVSLAAAESGGGDESPLLPGERASEAVMRLTATKMKRQRPAPNPSGGSNDEFRHAIVAEIAEAGKPLAPAQILGNLRAKGVDIPGSGSYNNFMGYLTRMLDKGELTKPARGVYFVPEGAGQVFDESAAKETV